MCGGERAADVIVTVAYKGMMDDGEQTAEHYVCHRCDEAGMVERHYDRAYQSEIVNVQEMIDCGSGNLSLAEAFGLKDQG